MSELLAVIEGEIAGRLAVDQAGRITFAYEDTWLETENAYSIWVSMQLAMIVYLTPTS